MVLQLLFALALAGPVGPVAHILPRQPALQVPALPAVALVLHTLSSPVRCVFGRRPVAPVVLPDQILLQAWLGVPPALR